MVSISWCKNYQYIEVLVEIYELDIWSINAVVRSFCISLNSVSFTSSYSTFLMISNFQRQIVPCRFITSFLTYWMGSLLQCDIYKTLGLLTFKIFFKKNWIVMMRLIQIVMAVVVSLATDLSLPYLPTDPLVHRCAWKLDMFQWTINFCVEVWCALILMCQLRHLT